MLQSELTGKEKHAGAATGRYLVACCSQSGATAKTFKKERLQYEVLDPIKNLIRANRIDYAIIAVPHEPSCPGAEGLGDHFGEDGPPAHKLGLTLLATTDLLKKGRFFDRVLVVSDEESTTPEELLQRALSHVPAGAEIVRTVKLGEEIPFRM